MKLSPTWNRKTGYFRCNHLNYSKMIWKTKDITSHYSTNCRIFEGCYSGAQNLAMKKIIPLEEGDFYLSEEGYRVFTAQYLLKRGYCCESGCRHCPYGFNKKAGKRDKKGPSA